LDEASPTSEKAAAGLTTSHHPEAEENKVSLMPMLALASTTARAREMAAAGGDNADAMGVAREIQGSGWGSWAAPTTRIGSYARCA